MGGGWPVGSEHRHTDERVGAEVEDDERAIRAQKRQDGECAAIGHAARLQVDRLDPEVVPTRASAIESNIYKV